MNETEKELAILNNGKMALVIMGELGPVLEKRRQESITKLKQYFREGTLDISKSLACAAELCTLEDIENDFAQKMRAADRVNKGMGRDRHTDNN